jgi:hypothetical protein
MKEGYTEEIGNNHFHHMKKNRLEILKINHNAVILKIKKINLIIIITINKF